MAKLAIAAAALVLAVMPSVAAAQAVKRAPLTAMERVHCKRFVPIGSLTRTKRICKTEREWQDERDAARAEGERLTEHLSGEREVAEIRPAGAPNF